jgi:kynurenine formamidase
VEIERLIGPAVVIDVADATQDDRDLLVGAARIEEWEAEHGRIPEGAIVLLRTGWDRFWPNPRTYLGDDTPGDASNLHFPSFGADGARLLVEGRHVSAIGIDAASIDFGQSTDFAAHRVVAAAGVPALENLARLDDLPPTGAIVIALPMKIAGGSGGPVRAIALVPRD